MNEKMKQFANQLAESCDDTLLRLCEEDPTLCERLMHKLMAVQVTMDALDYSMST